MSQDNPPPPRGLSSFANLLGSNAASSNASTISGKPVMYNQPGSEAVAAQAAADEKKIREAAALRMQPSTIKRPTAQKVQPSKGAKDNALAALQKAKNPPAKGVLNNPMVTPTPASQPPQRTTLDDFLGNDDDLAYAAPKAQRGGRRGKKKRKNKEQAEEGEPNWDEPYDPTRPNDYNKYLGSTEQLRAEAEWSDLLHHRHDLTKGRRVTSSDEEADRPTRDIKKQFAPPPSYFRPPPEFSASNEPVSTPTPANIPDDATGDDAFARRMRMSGLTAPPPPPPKVENESEELIPPPPSSESPAPPPAEASTISREPVRYDYRSGTGAISRAPVRYNLPEAPADMPSTEAELEKLVEEAAAAPAPEEQTQEDASRPKKGMSVAEKILAKYGWTKGKGLGAKETGIITPLSVQAEKRKKLPDSEGGGWAGPAGKGKIVGGKKAKGSEPQEEGKFGALSDVVVLHGMVDGLDLQHEMTEGNLVAEIGEECAEKYGRVERVFIHQHSTATDQVPVFVKFTSQMSALKAVDALNGRVFNGNAIRARFFDSERFERGEYE